MIPASYIQVWSTKAPWPTSQQVEQDLIISRANAEQRMLEKLTRSLTEDIAPLLPPGIHFHKDDAVAAFESIWTKLIARMKGDPWKQTERAIEELRHMKFPSLLRRLRYFFHFEALKLVSRRK